MIVHVEENKKNLLIFNNLFADLWESCMSTYYSTDARCYDAIDAMQ